MENGMKSESAGSEVNAGQVEGQKGSLIPAKKWTLKMEIKQGSGPDDSLVGYCTDVAVYSSGNIVLADTERNRLVTLSPSGHLLQVNPSSDHLGCFDTPTGVTTNKDDQLLVLDDNTMVKILNQKGELIREFTPFEDSGGVPSCIAVDGSGQIAVADEENDIIMLHNPDTSLLKTIPASMIGDYLTIDSKQNLLYTNFAEKKLLSVDYQGNKVISVDTLGEDNVPIHPSGLCCDSAGDIYVSAQTSPRIDCGEIHHFDPEGNYKGRVIQGLSNPFGIIFTPSGELVVADGVSVKIFHKV